MIRQTITLIICFLFPNQLTFWLLNLLGHNVHSSSRIGFSLIKIKGKLILGEKTRIGNFNIIKINSLSISKEGYIGNFNKINGPIEIILAETAAIGNGNKIYRAPINVTYGISVLQLGKLSKITGNHRADCTRSIIIGDYSTIAGHDSQLWTHAYYNDKTGPGRFRVDGEIKIGNNVYIGSRCIINSAVKIVDEVTVGSNSCVSKSLLQAGSYVSQPLRFLGETDHDNLRSKFKKIEGYSLCEEVYEREE
jgi:acetyltransferase-like isoleucine patch superfamily enzyme